ncbi:NAD(P)H-dependent flavin oxidoreductase [Ferrovibrio sp.]|uniref:NAD(P)H-dependent flavin oxidoreductase n=1 Tax=Ferrovibrio sp. TaxID=1917215 RepID=UPI003D0B3F48
MQASTSPSVRPRGSRAQAESLLTRLRLPVIGAPMFIISTPALVIAQCKAGIVGSIPALNARPKELLRDWIAEIKETLAAHDAAHPEAPAAPFAVNQIAHRTNERLDHDMRVIADAEVPIVIVSLAAPADIIGAVHGYGGLVLNDVVSARHARKCAEAGVDGLIAVCAGAGGHTGTQSPFALVPEIRQFWDGPLGLGGAIGTGRGIRAARILGADFAYIGTSFIVADEANAQEEYKDMVLAATAEDIVMSDKLTGVKANFLRPSLEAQGLTAAPSAGSQPGLKAFGEEGASAKAWRDVWSAGHGAGLVQQRAPVAALIETLRREYESAIG